MNSWFKSVTSKIKDDRFTGVYIPGPLKGIDFFRDLKEPFDLVFVDGHGDSRYACINEAFKKSSVLVTHDTEVPGYRWDLVKIPSEYTSFTYKNLTPFTTVFYKKSFSFDFSKI